jgi:hypothetical protein
MSPNKPQSNYSKRPVKKVRLLKIGQQKYKGLFEEYFYGFVVAICLAVMLLGKAGGMSGYNSIVTGLWVGGFAWSAGLVWRYRKGQGKPGRGNKRKQAAQAPPKVIARPLSPNFKPMIGPQWPVSTGQGLPKTPPAAGQQGKKPIFVYERPTLPDRKTKLPHNWPGQKNKKPKR